MPELNIQTVVLAGGLGTRMRSLWPDKPKPLIPVAGRPFVDHQLSLLASRGLHRFLFCVGYRGEEIRNYVKDGSRWGIRVEYSEEPGEQLLGTGGALVKALPLLEDRFMVLYGDAYLPIDYRDPVTAFLRQEFPAMMCVYRNQGRWDRSNAEVRDGRVVRYCKVQIGEQFEYIDYGINFFEKSVIERYSGREMPLDLAVIQSELAAAGELAAYEVTQRFYEIGSLAGLRDLEEFLTREQQKST